MKAAGAAEVAGSPDREASRRPLAAVEVAPVVRRRPLRVNLPPGQPAGGLRLLRVSDQRPSRRPSRSPLAR